MTVKIDDIKFIINDEQYYIFELNCQQINELEKLFSSSCSDIVKNKNVRISFPHINDIYFLKDLRPNQLYMICNVFKRIKSGELISDQINAFKEMSLTDSEKNVINSMANNDLKITKVAEDLSLGRNTVYRIIKQIESKTGLSPDIFNHLTVLFLMAKEQ